MQTNIPSNNDNEQSLEDVRSLFNDLIINEINKIIEEKTKSILDKQRESIEAIERKIDRLCCEDDVEEIVKKYAKYVHNEYDDDDIDESVQKQLESVQKQLKRVEEMLSAIAVK